MHSKNPMGMTRSTWHIRGDEYSHKMEMSQDGKEWKTVMSGEYRRKA